ncbi:MAG: CrcB family protein [Flavobacteriales bacterium]|nr:CrcB family protein [Flavobacteriales bacterium]
MNPLAPVLLMAIFFGGGCGSVTRHIFGVWLNGKTPLPLGTLLANIAATAILAWAATRLAAKWPDHPTLQAAVAIGFCGGFSTFSTFSADTHKLLAEGQWTWALANVLVSVAGCVLAFALVSGIMRR